MNSRYHMITSRYRDEWRKDVGMNRITASVDAPIMAIERLETKLADLRKSNRFSPAGLMEEMKAFAGKDAAPVIRKAGHVVDDFRRGFDQSKANLKVPKPDKSDVAGAILRMDVRNWLKSLNRGELAAVLMAKDAPEEVLLAAYEVPPAMIGADKKFMDDVQEKLIEIHHAPVLKQIDDVSEAVTIANNVVQVTLMDMAKCLMFDQRDRTFRDWFDHVSVEVDRQVEAERLQKQQTGESFARSAALKPSDEEQRRSALNERRIEALNTRAYEYHSDTGALVYNDPELNAA
ncbi:hypothetical protein ABIE78_006382 [Sinorhizobium fredii]|uniref:Uncharacterized protein n=1 Tax=Sinorhizobium fredii (strain USDA 257) TaxID=1185652 RepID=I3XDN5_SINF2|nr:hypothetical protein [Sinorhizobium fredii]AFL53991.1 hypothetical protein USDA257_c54760 [Sinorhizobium fredii USDA 257]